MTEKSRQRGNEIAKALEGLRSKLAEHEKGMLYANMNGNVNVKFLRKRKDNCGGNIEGNWVSVSSRTIIVFHQLAIIDIKESIRKLENEFENL